MGSVRHHRTALHRDQPHHRAKGRLQEVRRSLRGARQEVEGRQRSRRDREMGPAVNERTDETDLKYIEIGKDEGAKMKCGGNRLEGDFQHGWFVEPTVFVDVDPKMRIAQEEIFGPVVSIIPCEGLENAIEIANDIEYGLSSSIYTKDVNKAFTAMRDLYAGITYINAPTIGAEVHLPFGGVKATGNGHREGGIGAIDFYRSGKRCTSIIPTSCRGRRSIGE